MPVPQDSFLVVEEQARCLFFHKKFLLLWNGHLARYCGRTGKMPVPQKIFCYCGRTGKMPVPQKILLLSKNRQDACSTKNFVIVEEQARCLFHKKFFVIVERASCPFNIFWKFYQKIINL
ncbi:hypothetical protein [Microcoleus sp. D3_18_C1]|uniref:hypothetical protein n=1 Tax=Microcoleus sp. D3_18_C1 TaxID=3055333 RepID=UPI002FCFDEC4